jgi:hypothetical protein
MRKLWTMAAAALPIALSLVVGVSTDVGAEDGRLARIAKTDIGIYFRADPNNWESRGALAGVDGTTVTLRCAIEGMAVGEYDNRIWYKADDANGSGYLPDHFLDTPVKANQWLAGMPRCDESSNNSASVAPKSVFFSGTDTAKGSAVESVSDQDYALQDWASGGDCKGDHIPGMVPDSVNTLSGWSRGRIGIVYFLANASEEQKSKVHRIVLFDPAATEDIAGSLGPLHRNHGCDFNYDVNKLLADWLSSDSQNRLTVMTGLRSEMKEDVNSSSSRSTFAGLWKYYFAGIWNKSFAGQATVCDYNMLSHVDVMRDFASIVKNPTDSCPSAPTGHNLQTWHP